MPKALKFTRTDRELKIIAKTIKSDKLPEIRQRAMGPEMACGWHESLPTRRQVGSCRFSRVNVWDKIFAPYWINSCQNGCCIEIC